MFWVFWWHHWNDLRTLNTIVLLCWRVPRIISLNFCRKWTDANVNNERKTFDNSFSINYQAVNIKWIERSTLQCSVRMREVIEQKKNWQQKIPHRGSSPHYLYFFAQNIQIYFSVSLLTGQYSIYMYLLIIYYSFFHIFVGRKNYNFCARERKTPEP